MQEGGEEEAGWAEPGGELFEFAEEAFAGCGGGCYHESREPISIPQWITVE